MAARSIFQSSRRMMESLLGSLGVAAGGWLVSIPFMVDLSGFVIRANMIITGAIIVLCSFVCVANHMRMRYAPAWIAGFFTAVAGLWATFSSLIFNYPHDSSAFTILLATGLCSTMIACWSVRWSWATHG
ncbi:MAG: hypothetical protein GFH27_549293n55 [Chloroflexi bacterium AL-W]|nr:hypothetical protein [Chloroflexi bacterium AL-N1]NOK67831.1 hypothetical protein [Chloroflexi bacterium AL-N10]NOK75400.1 hypothetical protein [Chloroflexi bacterium AL-N5]NOK82188.1 hypothetical protein [Chloroflexi bacterium AL-W]NOK90033.1 hypothetical protein [Chloroflexi bacterium AL-N15]